MSDEIEPLDDAEIRRIAVHESGHAVAARRMGRGVHRIEWIIDEHRARARAVTCDAVLPGAEVPSDDEETEFTQEQLSAVELQVRRARLRVNWSRLRVTVAGAVAEAIDAERSPEPADMRNPDACEDDFDNAEKIARQILDDDPSQESVDAVLRGAMASVSELMRGGDVWTYVTRIADRVTTLRKEMPVGPVVVDSRQLDALEDAIEPDWADEPRRAR